MLDEEALTLSGFGEVVSLLDGSLDGHRTSLISILAEFRRAEVQAVDLVHACLDSRLSIASTRDTSFSRI